MVHESPVADVLHQACGGTVLFERRRLPDAEDTCTVLICQRCSAVLTSTSELNPPGAICGVVLEDVITALEQARGDFR